MPNCQAEYCDCANQKRSFNLSYILEMFDNKANDIRENHTAKERPHFFGCSKFSAFILSDEGHIPVDFRRAYKVGQEIPDYQKRHEENMLEGLRNGYEGY